MGERTTTQGDAMRAAARKTDRELSESFDAAEKALKDKGMTNLRSAMVDPNKALHVAVEATHWAAWCNGYSTGAGAKYLASEQAAGIPPHNNGPHPTVDPRNHRLLREAALMRLLNSPAELLGFLDRVYALAAAGPVDRNALLAILTEAGYPAPLAAAEDDGCPRNDPDCTSRADACHDACERPASDAAAINQSATAVYNAIRNMLGGTPQ